MTERSPSLTIPSGRPRYRVQEFADLAGLTAKTLRHYERLGLLEPARTAAGHRVYSLPDLDRLRRILALKRVGVVLGQMRPLLDADGATLVRRLATSRDSLARERQRLLLADRAITLVEESLRHAPADSLGLSRLADVIDLPQESAWMQRYFSDDAWEVARRFYERWPDEQWIGLYRDIAAGIEAGPGSAQAWDLLRRWNLMAQSLWCGFTSDRRLSRQLHDGFARAWRDRGNWPETIIRRFADYRIDEIAGFLASVADQQRTVLTASTR